MGSSRPSRDGEKMGVHFHKPPKRGIEAYLDDHPRLRSFGTILLMAAAAALLIAAGGVDPSAELVMYATYGTM
jgi:hypothetical protein